MSEVELNRIVRHARKMNRLGHDARCSQCGERDIRVLRKVRGMLLCADCHNNQSGRSVLEHHHIAGKKNDESWIAIPANLHSRLSDDQYDWPTDTLRNPNSDPLIEIAAWFRGLHDLFVQLADKLLSWAIQFEALSRFLKKLIGANWSLEVEGWERSKDDK